MSENVKSGGGSDKSEKAKAKKRSNVSGGAGKWFRELKAEFKKIVWPNLKQVRTNTTVVLILVVVVALFIALFDLIFKYGVELLTKL